MKTIDFYDNEYYMLSAFSAHRVEIWDHTFPTAEHAFHWKKFETANPEIALAILNAPSPFAAKVIAKDNKPYRRTDWSGVKVSYMEEISRVKCQQHTDVSDALTQSEDSKLVEDAPHDSFWGTGADGSGSNHIGEIWMRIRSDR